MACNMPIVATDVGDVRDVIGTTSGCFICNPDVEAFGARLGEILRHRLRTEGRDHIRRIDRVARDAQGCSGVRGDLARNPSHSGMRVH